VTGPIYSFDTSAFVDWWVRYYPPAILPSLKKQMEGIVQQGRLKASRSVYDELEVGGDELFKWVKSIRVEIIVEDDAAVQKLARPLIASYSSPNKPKNGLNGADPFIIAHAQKNSPPWIVVSGEKGDANNPKIGYVCSQLNIKCMDFRGFWTNEGWTF
jgi:Domain of unknown function (DUF4411)